MPTASTSQILGNNECFEAFTSNIYTRRTLAGEFKMVNKHLVNDLLMLGLWNQDVKDQIIICSYCQLQAEEIMNHKPTIIYVDDENKIIEKANYGSINLANEGNKKR